MKTKRGVTLIELTISIVIVSVCLIPVALMYQQSARGSYITRVMTVATLLAEEKMEEALMLGYLGVASVASTAFPSPFDDYNYEVIVHYVDPSGDPPDFDTPVDPTVTDYKSVLIEVDRSGTETVSLKSLLTNF